MRVKSNDSLLENYRSNWVSSCSGLRTTELAKEEELTTSSWATTGTDVGGGGIGDELDC